MSELKLRSDLEEPLLGPAASQETTVGQHKSLPDVLSSLDKQEPEGLFTAKPIQAMELCALGAVAVQGDGQVAKTVFSPYPRWAELASPQLVEGAQCVAVTPDGASCVTGGYGNLLQFWSLTALRETASVEITETVTTLAITADGRYCAVGLTDYTISLWEVERRTEVATWRGHEKTIGCIVFTEGGKYCLSGAWDNSIRVWTMWEGKESISFRGHKESITCLCATSDNLLVISGSSDHTLKIWSIEKQAELTTLYGHTDMITALVVTPDNMFCISAAADNTVRIWSIVKQIEVGLLRGHTDKVTSIALTPDGRYLVSGGSDAMVKLWSLDDKLEIANFKEERGIRCVGLMGDGNSVISGSDNGKIRIWTLVKRHEKPLATHGGSVTCMDLSSSGTFVVWGTSDHAITLWNIAKKEIHSVPCSHTEPIVSISFTADEHHFISVSNDKTVKLWSTLTLSEVHSFPGHENFITCLVPTGDSRFCLSGSQDTTIRLWDLTTKQELKRDFKHSEGVTCLAISQNDSTFVSGSSDKLVKVWGLRPDAINTTFDGHTDKVTCVALSPDSSLCVSGSKDQTVRLWGMGDSRKRVLCRGHTQPVTCVAFTPDGLHFISASEDGSLRVFDPTGETTVLQGAGPSYDGQKVEEMHAMVTFLGHVGAVTCIAVTPDSQFCLSAGEDKTVKIWSLTDFRMYAEHSPGPADAIQCLRVTRDQRVCLVGCRDNTVRSLTVNLCPWEDCKDDPTPYELISKIKSLKESVCTDRYQARACFPSHYFNNLHISAFGNLPQNCKQYLMMDVPLIRGAFGSPLTVALDRKAIECIDVFLQYLIDLTADTTKGDSTWLTFVPFTDDLPKLLESNSSLLVAFFSVLMQTPSTPTLPQFIIPIHSLPIIVHLDNRLIDAKAFQKSTQGEGEDLVKFLISLVRWNLSPGSEPSVKFLNALADCDNKLVLTAPFIMTIIQEKWSKFYPLTLGLTLLYSLLLINLTVMVSVPDVDLVQLAVSFTALNTFFLLYELAQMLSAGWDYLKDPWNYVDLVRCGLSYAWVFPIYMAWETDSAVMSDVSLVTVVFCFVRGFTYFRSFKMTRIFVYMTMAVVRDMYSFLVILAYSVFGFGVFASVLKDKHSIGLSWKSSFNLIMGNFSNDDFTSIEWVVFMGASVTNVIIMLNLLISILGEAYEKTQMSVRENDMHQQLTLLIEYESMLYWRKEQGNPRVMVTCEEVKGASAASEWSGVILEIVESIKTSIETKFGRMESSLYSVERRFTVLEEKLAGLASVGEKLGRLTNTEEKLAALEARFAGIEEKLGKLTGVGEKLSGVEGKFNDVDYKLARLAGIEDKLNDVLSGISGLQRLGTGGGEGDAYDYS